MKEINIQSPWFEYIKNGEKNIEGRLNKGIFQSLVVGDKIKIKNDEKFIVAEVINIKKYNTFSEYLVQEGLSKTLPNINSINEGCKIYYKFYTPQQEKKFGISSIHIKLLPI